MKIVLSTAPRLKNTNAHSSEAISIGLLSIATVLAQNEFRIFFIDANVLNLGIGDTLDMIMLNSPDIICFSVYTREMNIISELVNRIKRKKEKVIIILGGIHPTYFPVETIKYNKNFDYVVVGEGEEVLVKLISLIQVGALNEISELEGVFSQSDSFNIKPYFINIINDLSTLPIPNRNLYSKNESYSILTSRGCNHRCKFCMQPFEETVRYRNLEGVFEEVQMLLNIHSFKKLVFYDETFAADKDRTLELIKGFVKRGYGSNFYWTAGTRADTIDAELAIQFKKANCKWIFIGAESPIDEQLKAINKGIEFKQVENALSILNYHDINVALSFILGLPGETWETLEYKKNIILNSNAQSIHVGILIPHPGSKIYQEILEGKHNYQLLSADHKDYTRDGLIYKIGDITSVELNMYANSIKKELIIKGIKLEY